MERERYISLKSVLWRVVFAWKDIVISMIILAIALPLIKYSYDMVNYYITIAQVEEAEALETTGKTKEFSEEEEQQIREYLELSETIEGLKVYNKNSYYLNVNPLKAFKVELEYTIDKKPEYARVVAKDYVEYLSSNDFAESFFEEQDIKTEQLKYYNIFIQELVTASYELTENGEYIVSIAMYYEDEGNIANTELKYEDIRNVIENYVLKEENVFLSAERIEKVELEEIRTERNFITTALHESKETLDSIEAEMSKEQKQYVVEKLEKSSEIEDSEVLEQKVEIPSFNFKLVFVGAILGLVAVCGLVFIRVLFANKLQDIDEMSDFYNIKKLGVICDRKLVKAIDKWIYQKKNGRFSDVEKSIALAIENIVVACEKTQTKKVFITGSGDLTLMMKSDAYHRLIDGICKEGITVVEGGNILTDAHAYREMRDVGAVVFMETVGESYYKEIEEQLLKVKESGTEVIGCIVVA